MSAPQVIVPAPVLASFGDTLYDAVGPLAWQDDVNGWHLAHYCGAIGEMFQFIADVARDTPDGPGWSSVMDPATCPDTWIPWLAQFVGVALPPGTPAATGRDLIYARLGFQRGTPAAIRAAASVYLTGDKTVFFRERDATGADPPYTLEVVVETGELPLSDRGEPVNLVTNPSAELQPSFGSNSTVSTTPVNLLTNPSGETGTPTVVVFSASSAGTGTTSTLVDTTAWAKAGTHASRYNVLRSDPNPIINRVAPVGTAGIPVDPTHYYAFRFTAHLQNILGGPAGLNFIAAAMYWYTSAGAGGSPSFATGPQVPLAIGGTVDVYTILQPPAGAAFASPTAYIQPVNNGAVVQTITLDTDAFMLVDLGTTAPPSSGLTTDPADVPSYFDGSQVGYKWSGTANASTSVPDMVRTRTQDWARVGTWSTRISAGRQDGAAMTIRTDLASTQGTNGRFVVYYYRKYGARARVRIRSTSGPIEYVQLQAVYYQADNTTVSAIDTADNGPRVSAPASGELDAFIAFDPPGDCTYVSLRVLFKPALNSVAVDADVDALALYWLGEDFDGPLQESTNPDDIPAYVDGSMTGAAWNGAAHASTSHPLPTTLVRDAVMAQKPGGIVLSFRSVVGWDYQEMTTQGGTYATQTATYATYRRLSEGP